MTRMVLSAGVAALVASCAAGVPVPEWQYNAHGAMRTFEKEYLLGNTRGADAEFARARAELASTGRPQLVARAELTRCALQVASLDFDDCPGFASRVADAGPEERVYNAYLSGRWDSVVASRLPPQHREVVDGGALPADALSGLVAAGALLRVGRITPAQISAATETASANGWRRPLLAWLGVEKKRAADAGDTAAAARVDRRIQTVMNGGK